MSVIALLAGAVASYIAAACLWKRGKPVVHEGDTITPEVEDATRALRAHEQQIRWDLQRDLDSISGGGRR